MAEILPILRTRFCLQSGAKIVLERATSLPGTDFLPYFGQNAREMDEIYEFAALSTWRNAEDTARVWSH